ncbi:methylenetetrahydrofolate reductase [Reticulomyxa filosa]|uniref:Methylenetetrahydrofolate reductase n=1 Tax=Reticulomyxa filosa TaxID=46433 RepID=X6N089_RETFI|nr:methylenetetrahydrofolate reductase [Reticulomyxa filosa]|eukprot:ETO18737.1 methylenetetrahydrofolate reductase [Reticulomyxa filosa]
MTGMSKKELLHFLDRCKVLGIRNILALRGGLSFFLKKKIIFFKSLCEVSHFILLYFFFFFEFCNKKKKININSKYAKINTINNGKNADPPRGTDTWEPTEHGLEHGIDLVKLIRKHYGDWFSVGVAGYPEGHVESENLEEDLKYLKQKVINGQADWVTTLLFYDVDKFLNFYDLCRANGINVPIIPGLMPIQTYNSFVRIVSFSNVTVPDEVWKQLEAIKEDDEKVRAFGIEYCTQMCKKILQRGINVRASFFFFFFVRYVMTRRFQRISLEDSSLKKKKKGTEKKNERTKLCRACTETVRPIFWSNRDSSYIRRTQHWDDFPNGRWGDNRSPAFGEFPHHHLLYQQQKMTKKERLEMWGKQLDTIEDISKVFVKYLSQKISKLPWCMESVDRETTIYMLEPLLILNQFNLLTINSQPQINGATSDDINVGWGQKHGYVYQKAYLEFFCSKEQLNELVGIMKSKYPTLAFMAVNNKGDFSSYCRSANGNNNNSSGINNHTNAVTWGVFPSSEIMQPTIVDSVSFRQNTIQHSAIFLLWLMNSIAWLRLIENICETWYLVNIVENDYVNGDIFRPFRDLLRKQIGDKYKTLNIDQKLKTVPLISMRTQNEESESKDSE